MIEAIIAHDRIGGIGFHDKIPWNIPADMAHFKATTMGKTMVMGRKTWDSLVAYGFKDGLPGRKSVVLSKSAKAETYGNPKNAKFYPDLVSLLFHEEEDFIVIGGKAIYELLLPYIDTFYVTTIDKQYLCDTRINLNMFNQFSKSETLTKQETKGTFEITKLTK